MKFLTIIKMLGVESFTFEMITRLCVLIQGTHVQSHRSTMVTHGEFELKEKYEYLEAPI